MGTGVSIYNYHLVLQLYLLFYINIVLPLNKFNEHKVKIYFNMITLFSGSHIIGDSKRTSCKLLLNEALFRKCNFPILSQAPSYIHFHRNYIQMKVQSGRSIGYY